MAGQPTNRGGAEPATEPAPARGETRHALRRLLALALAMSCLLAVAALRGPLATAWQRNVAYLWLVRTAGPERLRLELASADVADLAAPSRAASPVSSAPRLAGDPDVQRAAGLAALAERRGASAAAALALVADQAPGPLNLFWAGYAAWARGARAQGLARWRQANAGTYFYWRGYQARRAGDLSTAGTSLLIASLLPNSRAETFYELADARQMAGDHAGAIEALAQGLRRDRAGTPRARVRAAQLAFEQQRFDQAERLLRELLWAEPDNPAVLDLLGAALFWQRRPAESLPYLRAASRLEPRWPRPWILAARASAQLGHSCETLQTATQALTTLPRLPDADRAELEYLRGRALLELGRSAEAATALQVAAQLAPDNTEYQRLLRAALSAARQAPAQECPA